MWEESGGHTFNIIDIDDDKITSPFPVIADKYIAPAILVICGLVAKGFDLINAIDLSILASRTAIKANDHRKLQILNFFTKLEKQEINIGKTKYMVSTFETVAGEKSVIHLQSNKSNLFIRPSGTGPEVRIYIFGPKETAEIELQQVKEYVLSIFDN